MTHVAPKLVQLDPWLSPYSGAIQDRSRRIEDQILRLTQGNPTGLKDFALGHEYFGLHKNESGWVFRERAPHATAITLIGDFSNWEERPENTLILRGNGVWELSLPAGALKHGDHYKMVVTWLENGQRVSGERIPAFCRRVVQDDTTKLFSAQVWCPESPYAWKQTFVVSQSAPRIYEAHVGMAQETAGVGTYKEFTHAILPRIKQCGYNAIQLMAIQEHPYYGSFGYQVSSFFAPSSRFGTPEDLMELVDTAHSMGIAVIMDLVHSHAVKNELEGISKLDGSYTLYFHGGSRGEHPGWNSRLFDYGKIETLHFLLSNCRYWLETFRFDGYRFDGVTSMIYHDHGLGSGVGSYEHYFCGNVDDDAVAYLGVANKLIHEIRPDAVTIAEEVTGMPGLSAPFEDGGVGFDYRLAMGTPDYWIKLLKHSADEEWNMSELWWELTNKRVDEKTIGYAESHDQALVGDKTIMFWLADKEMYWHMQTDDANLVIDRAVALHKMIRLITFATAGNGYLNFIGNEFGHPEWVDFPREGNNWSYHYARRQWSLRDSQNLKYHFLADFDRAMMVLLGGHYKLLEEPWPYKHYEHIADQVLAFERSGLLFAFNFHPTNSYPCRPISAKAGSYSIVMDSDWHEFGGHGRVDRTLRYETSREDGLLRLYLPSRSALVLYAE